MKLLHELLLANTRERGTAPAIIQGRTMWSYKEFSERVAILATRIEALCPRSAKVVLFIEASADAIALITACSKAGVTFVPIDWNTPLERLNRLLNKLQPGLIITTKDRFHDIANECVAYLDDDRIIGGKLVSKAVNAKDQQPSIDDLAYIIFTSGSTGDPKGIMMTHRAVTSFFRGLTTFMALPLKSRYATTSPLHFDYFLLDIGLVLGSGATLVLADRRNLRKPALFMDEMARQGVTHISAVPTVWKLVLQHAIGNLRMLTTLEKIVFAGEHFPQENIKKIYQELPKVRFINIYGQSETIACCFHELPYPLPDGLTYLPVGMGHTEARLTLVDQNQRVITEPNITGELYLSGALLFSGYFDEENETKKRLGKFLCNSGDETEMYFKTGDICYFDNDGVFYFIGRIDKQVQVYGNRVEPEEIEAVLLRHGKLIDACVVALETPYSTSLCAFVVPEDGLEGNVLLEQLRSYCALNLPTYMRPARIELRNQLPVTNNGKKDSRALLDELMAHICDRNIDVNPLKALG